jgi:hypothetical protein
MIDSSTCVQVSSVALTVVGGALLVALSTQGLDLDGIPSVFFAEITLARLLLCAAWAFVSVLYLLLASEQRAAPNVILAAIRVVILVSLFAWHRYWCMGDGWKLLRSRFVRPTLWRWHLCSLATLGTGAILSSILLWHQPGEAQYIENVVFQCLLYIGNFALFFMNQFHFYRGNIWFLIFLGFIWSGTMYGLALLVSVLVYSVPIPDPYALMGQSAICWIFAMVAYRCHIDVQHLIDELPRMLGVPTSRSATTQAPLKLASEIGANMSIVTVFPLSNAIGSGELECTSEAAAPVSSVAWATSVPSLEASPPPCVSPPLMQLETIHFGASAFRVPVANSVLVLSGSAEVASASGSDSTETGFIAALECKTRVNLGDESCIAPPEIVRLHKMVLSVIEFFFFTGTIWASETFVRLAFPSLAICGQLDLAHASWFDFAQAFFDFMSA